MTSAYELVRCVRARRIIDAIDCLRFGSIDAEYEGTVADGFCAYEGFYARHDGSGNHHVIAWSPYGVVALAFDHDGADLERDVPEEKRDPGRWLPGLVGLDDIRARVTAYGDRRATGGLWINGSQMRKDGETEQLDPYLLEVEEALEAWNDVEELGRKDRALVIELERKSRDKARKLTKAQQQLLLDRGAQANPVTPRGAEMAAKILAQLGIIWPEAKSKAVATRRTTTARAEANLGALQVALLEAVHARDLDATRAALDAGANPDCRAYKGQFADVHFVESPLVMATRTGDEAVALLLIERGAPMDEVDGVGNHPALHWAVLRGRVRVVRALLAAGATRSAGDHGFLVRTVCEGAGRLGDARMSSILGSIEDFAACIRVLLDAGASLPNTSWLAHLIEVAQAGGAEDVVPRLKVRPTNPEHAEHTLPAAPPLPPLPSVGGPREAVLDLLRRAMDRAGDPIGARTALMGAWRLTRNPRIADAIDVWDGASGRNERSVRGSRAAQPGAPMIVQGFDSALVLPAQPIAAREALGFVELPGVGCAECSARCIDSAAAVLVHVADVRTLEPLRRVVGASSADWSVFGPPQSLTAAIALLSSFRPADLDEEASALLARVEDVAAGRVSPSSYVAPISDLFRAVYAEPMDDTPRRILAERLLAIGDPRGEFIQLQLDRHGTDQGPTTREVELLDTHARSWRGRIDWALLDHACTFERGFVKRAATGHRHGASKSYALRDGAPVKFGDEDEWATIEQLSVGWHRGGTSGLLLSPKLRSLREVADVAPGDLDEVLKGEPRRWEVLRGLATRTAHQWTDPQHAARFAALPDALPSLRSLSFAAADLSLELIARVVARMDNLEELSLAYRPDRLADLFAIGADRGLTTVRLLLLIPLLRVRVGPEELMRTGTADLAVDVATRTITVEMSGRLHDEIAEGAAKALRTAGNMGPSALVLALPPGGATFGDDPGSPGLPATFYRGTEMMSLEPLWERGRMLGIPCSVGPELVRHWSPCEEALK